MIYTPKYFTINEFRCPCCSRVRVAEALVFSLDIFRRIWAAPIIVNSGFRCPKHNQEVGGVDSSRHLIGCAADVKPNDPALFDIFKLEVEKMFKFLPNWEIIIYSDFIHIAVPRDEQFYIWDGSDIIIHYK